LYFSLVKIETILFVVQLLFLPDGVLISRCFSSFAIPVGVLPLTKKSLYIFLTISDSFSTTTILSSTFLYPRKLLYANDTLPD